VMGTGVGEGETRSVDAARSAISSPLLEEASIQGARGVIINVTGGADLTLPEVSEASLIVQEAAHEDANIIWGAVLDNSLEGRVKITVIATGFEANARVPAAAAAQTPVDLHTYTAWSRGRCEPEPERRPSQRLAIARRQALELPSAMAAAGTGTDGAGPSLEISPLDVPAFLRRHKDG
jgi:cell division protein FtsZ